MRSLLLVLTIVFSVSGYSSDRKPADVEDDVNRALSYLPVAVRSKMTDYLEMIGVKSYEDPNYIGRDNEGLRTYNERMLENNRCLSTLAESFYEKMPKIDTSKGFLNSDFSIDYNSTDPGWLLRYANLVSKNNGNLTIALLGICGHDNAISSVKTFGNGEIFCPTNIFAPNSLGLGYNIDSDLITRVANIQAPTLGAKAIPAKSYHITAAAYQTCSLIKNGIPKFLATRIQNRLIYTYRLKRLCEKKQIGDYTFNVNKFGKLFAGTPSEQLRANLMNMVAGCKNRIDHNECYDLGSIISEDSIEDGDSEKSEKEIDQLFKFYWGYRLMSKYISSNDLCSNIQISNSVYNDLKRIAEGKTGCDNLENTECQKGRETVNTWAIDIEWSEAHHYLGSELASDLCSTNNTNLEEIACGIIDQK